MDRVIKRLEQLLPRNKAQLMEMTKTLSLVTILTLLIWIYAERAQNDKASIQLELDVFVSNPTQFATLIEPVNTPITVEIEGPRSKLDQLRTQLERRIRVVLPDNYEPETENNIPVLPLLNDYPEIRALGVTVTSASPGTIRVRIDPKRTIKVPVVLPTDLPVSISDVSIDPPSVEVTGPAAVLARLFPTPKSGIPLDLSGAMEKLNTPGNHRLENVPLQIPRETGLQVKPVRINSVRIDINTRETELILRTVPLVIQQPLPTVNRWEITTKEKTLTNIRVRGPASEIAKLQSVDNKPPEILPVAVLRLTNDDRNATDVVRPVSIEGLPQGVSLVGPAPAVEFSVREVAPRE